MRRSVVLDASILIAVLTAEGPHAAAAADAALARDHHSPDLAPYEATHVLRRLEARRVLSARRASDALDALVRWPLTLWRFAPLAGRAWDLRSNLTAHDAAYVALAEHLGAPLITLDRRLASAPGIRCEVIVPS